MYVHLTRSNPKGLGAYGFEDTPTAFTLKQEPLLVLLVTGKKTLPPPSFISTHTYQKHICYTTGSPAATPADHLLSSILTYYPILLTLKRQRKLPLQLPGMLAPEQASALDLELELAGLELAGLALVGLNWRDLHWWD